MNLCIKLADGAFPFFFMREGAGLENNGLKLRLIGLDGNFLFAEEEANTVQGYNDDVAVAGKTSSGSLKYGAVGKDGTAVLSYEYDALSLFFGGYAVGSQGGKFYIIEKNGTKTEILKDVMAFNSLYGFFVTKEGGYTLLYNNKGDVIIDSAYFAEDIILYTDPGTGDTYAAVKDTNHIVKVLRLR
jgi:hypothetical protein